MALIVIETCSMGLTPTGDGVALRIAKIEGFPEGLDILLPMSKEATEKLISEATRIISGFKVADMSTLRKETHGPQSPSRRTT